MSPLAGDRTMSAPKPSMLETVLERMELDTELAGKTAGVVVSEASDDITTPETSDV